MRAPHSTRIALALVTLAALSGCSLFNKPDRGRLDGAAGDSGPSDGGMVDADAAATDGAVDGCITGGNEICDNDLDDNCNGLVDCADFECAEQVECCSAGTPSSERWTSFTAWNPVPVTASGLPEASGGRITNFSADPKPSGVISRLCQPLAAGLTLTVRMRIEPSCGGTCSATFALTPAANARPGELVVDDLGVTLFGDGHVATSQNRRTRAMTPPGFVGLMQDAVITIDIVPGTDSLGRASLLATVTAKNGATEVTQLLEEGFPFVAQDVLLTGMGRDCAAVPGLNLAFQGDGSGISIGELTRTPLECVNPGQLLVPDEPCVTGMSLTAGGAGGTVSLGMGMWATGGVSAPALLAVGDDWHVLADSTSADRTLEDVTYLGYGVGHARTDRDMWCDTWASTAAARQGPCNASCLGVQSSTCMCSQASVREPSAVDDGSNLLVAYAVQPEARTDAYEIAIDSILQNPMVETGTPTPTITRALHADECTSLRDPALVRAGPEPSDGYWLFFTCELERPRSDIRAIRLTSGLTPMGTSRPVLAPVAGTYSAGAIYAPEVLVEHDPSADGRHIFRLWALARDATQSRVSVALFQGQLDAQQAMDGDLPTLVPFGANPIITEDHAIFSDCPDCELLGLSVARVPGSQTLRLLVARRVNGGTAADYQLVPYEQYWVSPFDM